MDWEMLPVLDCVLIEPSFLTRHWLKVDGKVPHKTADSQASASVSICFGAAGLNLCNGIGIFNLVLRAWAKMAGLRRGWIATIDTRCSWSCAAFVRRLCSETGRSYSSQVWKRGLIWLQVAISSVSFLKSHNACFPKKHVSWTWIYQHF